GVPVVRRVPAREREREGLEWTRRRREGMDLPEGLRVRPDRGHDAGANQRALTAARRADDRQECSGSESCDQFGGQGLATEEEPRVALIEVLQTLERRLARRRRLVTGALRPQGGEIEPQAFGSDLVELDRLT